MSRLSNGTIIGTAVLALALLFMLFYCNNAHAQQPQFVYSQTYASAQADQGYATANGGAVFWKLTWAPTAASACVVAVDSSANGSSWTAGGVIAGQTCTSGGSSAVVNVSSAFVRINLTSFTGTSVKVTLQGWASNPSGGSSFTGGAVTTPITAANGAIGAPSYSFTNATDSGLWWSGTYLTISKTNKGMMLDGSIARFGQIGSFFNAAINSTSATTGFQVASGTSGYGFSATTDASGALDAAVSRGAAGQVNCGNGTAGDASGLCVGANVPASYTFWSSPAGNTASGTAFTLNVESVWGIIIDRRLVGATKIRYNVGTADAGTGAGHLYNLTLYNSAGTRVADCGATDATVFAPTTGVKACTVGSFTVTPGLYFVGITTDCTATCAALNGTTAQWVYVSNSNAGATASAASLASFTPPAASYTQVNTAPSIQIN